MDPVSNMHISYTSQVCFCFLAHCSMLVFGHIVTVAGRWCSFKQSECLRKCACLQVGPSFQVLGCPLRWVFWSDLLLMEGRNHLFCGHAAVLWQARAGVGYEQPAPHAGNSIPEQYRYLNQWSLRVWPLHSWHSLAGKFALPFSFDTDRSLRKVKPACDNLQYGGCMSLRF